MKGLFLLIVIVGALWYFDPGGYFSATLEKLPFNKEETVEEVGEAEDAQNSPVSQESSTNKTSSVKNVSETKTPVTTKEDVAVAETVTKESSETDTTSNTSPPEVSLSVSSIIIEDKDSLTLTWDVKNADSCKSSGFLAYGEMSGELKFNPSRSTTYELNCSGSEGDVSKSVYVKVVTTGTGVVLQSSVLYTTSKDPITLTWDSINASSCTGTGFSAGGTSGSVSVSPKETTRYRITCLNTTTGASAEESVLVKVTIIEEDSSPPDTTAPVISNGLPTGTFSETTTEVTLSVQTDEEASCRYTLFAGTRFDDMTNFGYSNATEHKEEISGLTPHAKYRYYVRCEDEFGNQNQADYLLEFVIGIVL